MILFWILLVLLVLVSASLAYLSMKDYQPLPEILGEDYGLFLIRKPNALDSKALDFLHTRIANSKQILSLERLFKGVESALVIYGPKAMLQRLNPSLDLVEIEDYSKGEAQISGWEARFKSGTKPHMSIFSNFPKLEYQEQVWYQMLLQAGRTFNAQIRVVVRISDLKRRELMTQSLQKEGGLVKIPQAFSSMQILDFYKKRSMVAGSHFNLTADEIVKAWSLP